jgi:hypothetical protein
MSLKRGVRRPGQTDWFLHRISSGEIRKVLLAFDERAQAIGARRRVIAVVDPHGTQLNIYRAYAVPAGVAEVGLAMMVLVRHAARGASAARRGDRKPDLTKFV